MLKGLTKLIGGSNEKVIEKIRAQLVDRVNSFEPELEALSDAQLRAKTDEFRRRLQVGQTLDDMLHEAFAVVREAAKRALSQRHFDVQLIGGFVLHEGKIAEMKTGEGKTLVATLPAYLNALTGNGVHVITVNDYLARRDAQWMGQIYDLLGVSVGVLQHEGSYIYDSSVTEPSATGMDRLRPANRMEAYAANITYGTNNDFGFDYLRDNMVVDHSQRAQRQRSYAIVDEVDNILIDEARTPLIISGPAEQSPKEYARFARVVPSLTQEQDYTIDEKHRSVSLTIDGMNKLEKLLGIKDLYEDNNASFGIVHHVETALKAENIFQRDRDYVVSNGEVVIVDEFTGRLMTGRRFSDGLHQALEAKERVNVRRETITYATITLQNYFRLYEKLSGMTGTAATEAEEFWKIYKLEVVEIPTNQPMIRADRADLIYKNQQAKYEAVVGEIETLHKEGKPILVGTTDIDKSELLSEMLMRRGIPHEVLNAKQHEREAAIIAQAGQPGAITVATNMAGRGTDIILGGNPDSLGITREQWDESQASVMRQGGLHIIGTERHEARRIDNQLRGRAGRQGDVGSTKFFVALDDELMRRFGGERISGFMEWAGLEDDVPIENKMISKSIESAQIKVEAYHFDMRKHLVDYDDVINTHRDVIYTEREKVLSGADMKAIVQDMVETEMLEILSYRLSGRTPELWDVEGMIKEMGGIFPLPSDMLDPDEVAEMSFAEIEERLLSYAGEHYEKLEEDLTPELMRKVEQQVLLRAIDHNWVQHLTSMENLRQGIGLYAYGQRDPPRDVQERGSRDVPDPPGAHSERHRPQLLPPLRNDGPRLEGRRRTAKGALRRRERHVQSCRRPLPRGRDERRSQGWPKRPVSLRQRQEVQALLWKGGMNNSQIAEVFENIAGLLEIKGEKVFTIRAYQRAARTIERLPSELDRMVREEQDLREIPGIGKAISDKIVELLESGRLGYYERLREEFPDGMIELMQVPGLGPKTTARVWKELGVTSVPELEDAATDGRLASLPRMGKKTADNILRHIQFARTKGERTPIAKAMPAAERVIAALRGRCPAILRLDFAGSLRRYEETVGDVDLVCHGDRPSERSGRLRGPSRGGRGVGSWRHEGVRRPGRADPG